LSEEDKVLFKNLEKSMLNRAEMAQRQMDFRRGIVYGLIYGIVGNMAVQFGYQVFEEWILGTYNQLFWLNLTLFLFSVFVIVLVTIWFANQISNLRDEQETYINIAKSAMSELKRRIEMKANQK
jgi:hypothetical protein